MRFLNGLAIYVAILGALSAYEQAGFTPWTWFFLVMVVGNIMAGIGLSRA